nr:6860_t:CDS:2 [Entrophospora candida]
MVINLKGIVDSLKNIIGIEEERQSESNNHEQSITAPNENLELIMIEKQDSSPTIALDENSNHNTSTLEITSEDQIPMSMKSSNRFDGTFVLEPLFASSLAKPTSILSTLEKPTSFGNIPITIPVQYEINKEDDIISRNVINEVLVEEEMEEYEEEIFTTKHLSDPNERKRTIYSTNNNQEEKTRKCHTSNVNKIEDGNVVRKAKKRSYSKLGNPTVEIIQNQLSLHEFFNQKSTQMKKVKDDLLEKLEGLHSFLSNIEFLRESVALGDNEISGLIISITSCTGDLISNHSSEEGAFSIIKRYNKLLETCQEILEKEC